MARRNQALFLVESWIEEALASDSSESDTRVIAKRPPRDSYTHDRPLLSTGIRRLPPRDGRPSDLNELSPLLEGDESEAAHFFD